VARKRLFPYFFILLLLTIFACGKDEERAVWVVRFDLKTEDNVKKIVCDSKAAGFNMILAQVYGRADAYYNSYIVPRAEVLEDQPEDYDPLKVMIAECRKKGLKIHAWVNAYYIWQGVSADDPETYPKSEKHIVHLNPEWIIKDSVGKRLDEYTGDERKLKWVEGLYADPSNKDYKDYFLSVCKEIIQRYDVDGLHLDFIRYPGGSFGYNDKAVADFKTAYGVDPFDLSQSFSIPIPGMFIKRELPVTARWEYYYHSLWIDSKSEYVTSLVADIRHEIDEMTLKRKVNLSAAVFPDKNKAYFAKSQDWGRWLDEGYLDMIMPMAYSGSKDRVVNQIYNVKKAAGDIKVLAGLGVYMKNDCEIKREVHSLNKFNIDGYSFFSYGGMMHDADYSEKYTDIRSVRRKLFTPAMGFDSGKEGLILPPGYGETGNADSYKYTIADIESDETRDEVYDNILKKAKGTGYKAKTSEVDRFLDCMKKQFYSNDAFDEFIKRNVKSVEKFKMMLEDDITVFKFITEKVYRELVIDEDEMVTIPKKADYQMIYKWQNEKREIDKIYLKLKRGEDFAELAKKYSRSSTASNGGYYKNKFYDELDDVSNIIFTLKEGEMTKVIKRPSGYAIYKINELTEETELKYKVISNAVKKMVFYNKLKEAVKAASH
jgi:uncharacterized lipoprotein YddW (UPF0748 family)